METSIMRMRMLVLSCGLLLGAAWLTGCADHYSTQDAYSICQDLQRRNPGANPPDIFATCVTCYEDCGADCTQGGTALATYECP